MKKEKELFEFNPRLSVTSYRLKSEFIEKELKLQAEKSDLKRELQILRRQFDEDKKHADNRIKNLEEILLSSTTRENQLKEEIDKLNDQLVKTLKYAEILNNNLNNLKGESEKLVSEKNLLENRLKTVLAEKETALREKDGKLSEITEEKRNRDNTVNELNIRIGDLTVRLNRETKEKDSLSRRISGLEHELETSKERQSGLEKTRDMEIVRKEEEFRALAQEMEKTRSGLTLRLELREAELTKKLDDCSSQLEHRKNELRLLNEKYEQQISEEDREIKAFKNENEVLRREAMKTRDSAAAVAEKDQLSLRKEVEKLTSEIQTLKNRNLFDKNLLEEEVHEKETAVKETEEKYDKKLSEMNIRMRTLMEEFNKNEKKILSLEETVAEEKHKTKLLTSGYELKIKTLEERLSSLQSK